MKMKVAFNFSAAVFAGIGFAACGPSAPTPTDGGFDASVEAPPPPPLVTITATRRQHALRDARALPRVGRDADLRRAVRRVDGSRAHRLQPRSRPRRSLLRRRHRTRSGAWIDLPGFSTGVESYEYSKQPMNNIAFESGAGTSLVYGPLVNAGGALHGAQATARARDARSALRAGQRTRSARSCFRRARFRDNRTSRQSRADRATPTRSAKGQASENPLGWPGIWPTVHVFRSFDPTIAPTSAGRPRTARSAPTTIRDRRARSRAPTTSATRRRCTCAIARRRSNRSITPGADGFSAWKYGLWVLNYLQVMHDSTEAGVATRRRERSRERRRAGQSNRRRRRHGRGDCAGHVPRLERHRRLPGADVHRGARQPRRGLAHATSRPRDGATLSGFATTLRRARVRLPSAAALVPARDRGDRERRRERLSDARVRALVADSELARSRRARARLLRVLRDHATRTTPTSAARRPRSAYSTAIRSRPTIRTPTASPRCTIARSRCCASRSSTWIASTRDPSGVLVDDVTMNGTTPARGTTVATTSVAYAIIAMRTALRALCSQLELYSNNTPDTAIVSTPLDALPINHPSSATFSQRVRTMLRAQGALLYDHLTDATGRAYSGWDVATSQPTDHERHARRARGGDSRALRDVPRDGRREIPRPRDGRVCATRRDVLRRGRAHLLADARADDRRRVHAAALRAAAERIARRVRARRGATRRTRRSSRSSKSASAG